MNHVLILQIKFFASLGTDPLEELLVLGLQFRHSLLQILVGMVEWVETIEKPYC